MSSDTSKSRKKITRTESYKLLGLFLLASEHYRKARTFEFALNEALGKDRNDQGHLSDLIYCSEEVASTKEFYEALRLEGYDVTDK